MLVMVWARHFSHAPKPNFSVVTDPILFVSYNSNLSSGNLSTEQLMKEKIDYLNLTSSILPLEWPKQKSVKVDVSGTFADYADESIIFASDRQTFINHVTIPKTVDLVNQDNSTVSLLNDSSYEKYAQIVSDRTYNLYFELDTNFNITPDIVIINGKGYKLGNSGRFYTVNGYQATDTTVLAVKSPDGRYSIKNAAIAVNYPGITGLVRTTTADSRSFGNFVDFVIPDKNYILIEDANNNYYQNSQVRISPSSSSFYYYQVSESNVSRINLQNTASLSFIAESGRYKIGNQFYVGRGRLLVVLTLFSLMVLALLIYFRQSIKLFQQLIRHLRLEMIKPISRFFAKNVYQIFVFMGLIIFLLVIRLSPIATGYLTPTNLLAIIILGSVIIARCSLRYLSILTLVLVAVTDMLVWQGHLVFAEKIGRLMFLPLLIYAIVLNIRASKKDI